MPAQRAITVRDLLTYRMGFGSVMAMPDTYPIQKLIREYRIGGDGPMLPSQPARHGRMAGEARLAALAGATGRAVDVSRERGCARGLDRARRDNPSARSCASASSIRSA